jgi:prepilin-type N-terminal cleavage/methylation domain-containing protein
MKKLFRDDRGFTITETMIVLAIAGLILLLIFEAIPALERSSRNNQRRQDVQTILAAVSHYELNDSGNFPANCGVTMPINGCTADAGLPNTEPNDFFLKSVKSQLTFYDPTVANQVVLKGLSASAGAQAAVTDPDTIKIYNHQKCNADGSSTDQGAGYNDVVALFAVETGNSGHQAQCQQL